MEIRVMLYNLRSLHNVGSIFRTSDAAGVSKIYLAGTSPAPLDRLGNLRPQLTKVALGAERTVPWEKVRSAPALIRKLEKDGFKIFAVEQARNSIPYYRAARGLPRAAKIVLVFGNEVRGLPPAILKSAGKILEIPMRRTMVRQVSHPRHAGLGKESLNVAVAFGIVVFGLRYGK